VGHNSIKEKILLLKFEERFITSEYIGWLNNKSLMQFSEQRHNNHTMKTCKNYYRSFSNSDNLLYAILNAKTNEHVGNINAYIDSSNKVADMGIIIGKTGCGYGSLAWKEMIRVLFLDKRMRKITAGAMKINKPMIKIFLKSGMEYEYTKTKHFIYNEQFIDLAGYSIFNPETIEN